LIDQEYERGSATQTESGLEMHRVAVLPFTNIGPDPGDDYFADGLTEELISKLSLVPGLKVIARTSTMRYKGSGKSIAEIGRELGCGILVEGSIRKGSDKIRVSVQVIDANNEEHLWSSVYDNNLDDIFAIQDEIANKVSRSLPGYVLPKSVPLDTMGTRNLEAYTCYLKGKQLYNERTDDSLRQALELFKKAAELDPNFARAYVGMGNCYPEFGVRSLISSTEGLAAMKTAVLRALQINEDLAEAHSLMSVVAWSEDDYSTAEKEARKALELNSNLADANFSLGRVLLSTGYPKSALKMFQTAHSLDPLFAYYTRFLGLVLSFMGRDSEALDLWNQNMKVSPFEMHLARAEYYLAKKQLDEAEKEISELEMISPSDFNSISFRGYILAARGNKEATQEVIRKLDSSFKDGATLDRTIGYLGYFFGDMNGFFYYMFRAVDQHVIDSIRLRYSPIFDKARKDPRYRDLLDKNGLDPDLKESLF
jgi:adenylate cyclase